MPGHLLLDTRRPFTHAQADDAGIHDRDLAGPAYRKCFSGVYVAADVPDTVVVRTRAALLVAPSKGTVSHLTAARLWGGHLRDPRIHLSYTRDVRTRVDGILTHRFLGEFAVCRRHGLPVTTPDQTFVHCAVKLDLIDLVAFGDRLVKRGATALTSVAALDAYAEMWQGQGGANARRAVRFIRPNVDSVPETHLRLLIVLAGLPEPTVDIHVRRVDGTIRYRLDMGYEEHRLAIEYDGRWHEEPDQARADEARRSELADEGWRFEVVRSDDLYERPAVTLLRLAAAMRERDVPTPPRLSDRWHRYFAGHTAIVA